MPPDETVEEVAKNEPASEENIGGLSFVHRDLLGQLFGVLRRRDLPAIDARLDVPAFPGGVQLSRDKVEVGDVDIPESFPKRFQTL